MTGHTEVISKSIKDALQQAYVFARARDEDLDALVAVSTLEELPAKIALVTEGQNTSALHVLARGRLVVKEAITPTSELIIARINPGEVVGEIAFFDGKPASASVRTDEPATVVQINNVALTTLFKERPSLELAFYRAIVGTLTTRLRNSNQVVRSALSSSMMPRL